MTRLSAVCVSWDNARWRKSRYFVLPFTPTHVVAILPLWPIRRWLPFPALATGAMIPDVGLFFSLFDYAQAHSVVGLFTSCLPLGIALFLMFETLMRRPLIALMPEWFQQRLDPTNQIPTRGSLQRHVGYWIGIAAAVVLGALSHQVWDAFTHQGRWGTRLIPILNSEITLGHHLLPGYKIIQHGSSLIGLPLLVAIAVNSLARTEPKKNVETASARTKTLVFVAGLVFPFLASAYSLSTSDSVQKAVGVAIKMSGAFLLLLGLVYCLAYQKFAIGSEHRE